MPAERKTKSVLLKEKFISPLFFLLFLLTGLFIFDDYGLAWDADYTRERGILNYNYIGLLISDTDEEQKEIILQDWNNYPYHDHGVFFDLLATAAENLFSVERTREAYLLRHLLIFLFFFAGCIFFYFIIRMRLPWFYALAGVLFLILSPRIFAHAFFNPKDIIFMVMVIVSLYTSILFLKNFSIKYILLHALVTAIAIDVRITGIFIPFITIVFLIPYATKYKRKIKNTLLKTTVYLISLSAFVIIFWPYLWSDPLQNFQHALQSMSAYNWDDPVLYLGESISAVNLPWHYPLIWISISTPIIYMILFFVGLYLVIRNFIKTKSQKNNLQDILILSYFLAPLLAVIILDATLYDGWRQLYFIYPPLLIITLVGTVKLIDYSGKWIKLIIILSLAVNSLYLIYNMVKLHPYQHLYFNVVAGKHPDRNFDMDYWGLSYREAYEEFLNHSKVETISFVPANNAGFVNLDILTEAQKQRLNPVPWDSAEYFITNYRWVHPREVDEGNFPYDNEILTIKRCGLKVAGVYKLR